MSFSFSAAKIEKKRIGQDSENNIYKICVYWIYHIDCQWADYYF